MEKRSLDEMVHTISNLTIKELDAAIAALRRVRDARAEELATTAFAPGDVVSFEWPSTDGPKVVKGKVKGPSNERGHVTVKGLEGSTVLHEVDAAKLERIF